MKNQPLSCILALLLLTSIQTLHARPLNDTGIIRCVSADDASNDLDCPQSSAPGQDAQFGRDVSDNDDSDGHAGFSFTKLDDNGNALPASASTWACVQDNVTGLIWEVKTDNGGLHDKDHSYTWYSSDSTTNGGDTGSANGGICAGSYCDTQSYVQAMNSQGLCGVNDWRLPTLRSLISIVDFGRNRPAIDTDYFPNTQSIEYWSASSPVSFSNYAWSVGFNRGFSYDSNFVNSKDSVKAVRLVSGGQ